MALDHGGLGGFVYDQITLSDLVLTTRGTVRLDQHPVSASCVNGLGVLLADNNPGQFRFEIQYIQVCVLRVVLVLVAIW